MIHKSLSDITETDLQDLVTNKVMEGKTIEYKVSLPGNADQDKVRYLRAVSSFANTSGGDLIYGIDAPSGVPTDIPGLSGINEDQERLRLENLCRDGVQERVRNLNFKFISLATGVSVLVIRVPKSWNAPHRVVLNNHCHFYARNSGGAYQLDVPELRAAFNLSPTLAARIRSFREDRLAAIVAKDTPVPLEDGGIMVFHIAPLISFMETDMGRLEMTREQCWKFSPPNVSGMSLLHNFDGYCVYYGGDKPVNTYVQLFRTGVIEYVVVFNYTDQQERQRLPGPWIEKDLHDVAPRFSANLDALGVPAPYYFLVSFLGIGKHFFETGSSFDYVQGKRTAKDNLLFPEVAVESANFEVPSTLRPIANLLWNSFGYERSFSYNEKGEFVRKKW